jgi:hypothetical protein
MLCKEITKSLKKGRPMTGWLTTHHPVVEKMGGSGGPF